MFVLILLGLLLALFAVGVVVTLVGYPLLWMQGERPGDAFRIFGWKSLIVFPAGLLWVGIVFSIAVEVLV